MTRHALDGLTYGTAWQRAVGQAPALESLPGCAGTDGGEIGHGGIDLAAVSETTKLGPSLSGGSAGVRHESRPAPGADLTGPLMVRPQGKAVGVEAHSATGRTCDTSGLTTELPSPAIPLYVYAVLACLAAVVALALLWPT